MNSALVEPISAPLAQSADETVRQCEGILERHARSFSAAAVFLSPKMRKEAAVCYAFCRVVDDAVDEAESLVSANGELTRIEAMLDGRVERSAIVAAYVELAERLGFGLGPAHDLLEGMRSDLGPVRIASDVEFLEYCYRVAGTVGLMMCGVLGVKDEQARRHAVELGIAMQMTNICRDVLEDSQRDRVYLPETRLRVVQLSPGDVARVGGQGDSTVVSAAVRTGVSVVVRGLLDWADTFYESGAAGFRFIPARPRLAIVVARSLYREIGETLRGQGCDPLRGRARVSGLRKFVLTVRSAMKWFIGVVHTPSARLELPARLSSK